MAEDSDAAAVGWYENDTYIRVYIIVVLKNSIISARDNKLFLTKFPKRRFTRVICSVKKKKYLYIYSRGICLIYWRREENK